MCMITIKLTDQWSAASFSSLIAALRAWCMFVCYNACGGHPPCHVCVCLLSEGLAPWIGLCSGAISGRSVWQGNLVLLFFDVVV